MYTSGVVLISYYAFVLSVTVNINKSRDEITSKHRHELTSWTIMCELTDILYISVPIVNYNITRYYLYSPKGEVRELDEVSKPRTEEINGSMYLPYNNIILDTIENEDVVISRSDVYSLINLNRFSTVDTQNYTDLRNRTSDEFLLGPVDESYHGNWIISLFYKRNSSDEWREIYRVFNVDITVYVPPNVQRPVLREGETFHLGFAYAIPEIESCQLTAPASALDKCFDRNHFSRNRCGFVVNNLTDADSGMWTIIGVGRVHYESHVELKVVPRSTPKENVL